MKGSASGAVVKVTKKKNDINEIKMVIKQYDEQ